MNRSAFELMNKLGSTHTPFLFVLDYKVENPLIIPLNELDSEEILFSINGFSNFSHRSTKTSIDKNEQGFKKRAVSFQDYLTKFQLVQEQLKRGNSYLLNLTQPTEIETSISFKDIFHQSRAKYRLWIKNRLVLFSPECFIKINGERISSYPMKGTIDASILNAKDIILNDAKETAEHITIVDLIRNDLGLVAKEVKVDRFRYVDKVKTSKGALYQVSSEISARISSDFHAHLGDIFSKLLPAGSITGAPKKKTCEIIETIEGYKRGYYTGVFGYYDGNNLESSVMIRIIEKENGKLFYKSGGGITIYSDAKSEYKELIEKIYLSI